MAYQEEQKFHALIKEGWTKVLMDPWKVKSFKQICDWCDCYCPDEYATYGNYFVFRQQKQALWFKLRWL